MDQVTLPKATCRHCKRDFDVTTWDGKPRLPNHRLEGSLIACDGTGQMVADAGENYDGPLTFENASDQKLARSPDRAGRIDRAQRQATPSDHPPASPSFYDKEERSSFDDGFEF